MNLRFSVEEMIKTFGPTYRTIEVRSAAVRLVEGWLNAYAVVRLSYEEPAVAEGRLRKLEREQGIVKTDLFRVFLGVRPFSEWSALCEELAQSKMLGTFSQRVQRGTLVGKQSQFQGGPIVFSHVPSMQALKKRRIG